MLNDNDRLAAKILANMPDAERLNAARLGYVALEMRFIKPSFSANTVEINPEILDEEARLRANSSSGKRESVVQ